MRVVVALAPDSPRADAFRRALAAFDINLRFGTGEALLHELPEAEVFVGSGISDAELAAARKLRWVSFWHAGIERLVTPALLARGIAITNASGVHGPNIAEHVLGFMLMFTRRLHRYVRAQLTHTWLNDDRHQHEQVSELTGQTLLLVGFGRIGEAIADRAKPFGLRILGVKRDPAHRHGTGAVDGVFGFDALDRLLPEADHVCLAVPMTPQTRHLIDARRLALMKRTAYLYNVARGGVVDEAALIDALRKGTIAGAGLDVFEEEPLSPDSPLWDLPNVILTPHVSGLTPFYFDRAATLFAENLGRFIRGLPLFNRYDASRGY